MRMLFFLSLTLVLAACGKHPPAPSAGAETTPAFKIAEEQRKQLEQAKALEQELAKAAEDRKKAIDEATR